MEKLQIKELSAEGFRTYGTFARMVNPEEFNFGAEPIEFYRDMVQLDLGEKTSASFSTCRVCKRPAVIGKSEFHSACGEGILPLDADILIHVGPATRRGDVPLDRIEIFRVPKGTMVSLRPGVWHHAPFAHNAEVANVLIVLPERTYANDCEVFERPGEVRIEIEGA